MVDWLWQAGGGKTGVRELDSSRTAVTATSHSQTRLEDLFYWFFKFNDSTYTTLENRYKVVEDISCVITYFGANVQSNYPEHPV